MPTSKNSHGVSSKNNPLKTRKTKKRRMINSERKAAQRSKTKKVAE